MGLGNTLVHWGLANEFLICPPLIEQPLIIFGRWIIQHTIMTDVVRIADGATIQVHQMEHSSCKKAQARLVHHRKAEPKAGIKAGGGLRWLQAGATSTLAARLPSFPLTLSEASLLWTFPNADSARAAEYGHAPVWSESMERSKRTREGRTGKKEKGEPRKKYRTQNTRKKRKGFLSQNLRRGNWDERKQEDIENRCQVACISIQTLECGILSYNTKKTKNKKEF